MLVLATNPMLPPWAVLPLAAVALLVIGGHISSLRGAPIPGSRKRIRMASGVILGALTLLLAYAMAFVGVLPSGGGSAGEARAFVLIWMAIIGLLPIVLGLAGMDMVNTMRLRRAQRVEQRREMRQQILRDVEIRVKARFGGSVALPGGESRDPGERR